jgi:hypothetical protein
MNKLLGNRIVIADYLAAFNLLVYMYFSFSPEADVFAQQQGTIYVDQATAPSN